MRALAALTGALVAASWQVALVAAAYALLRLGLAQASRRYLAALLALLLQLGWPVATFIELLGRTGTQVNPGPIAQGRWWLLVPLAWSLGATLMLGRLLGGLALVRAWIRRAGALEASLEERFERLRVRLGVRPVRFGVAHLDTPLTVGFWRPVVLVPVSVLTALPVETLELLVAHELVHVRRWDALVSAVQMLIEALLFFHPAMWWVSRSAREEREYSCDDAVVQCLGRPRRYAAALVALEQSRQPATDLAVASTGGAFMERIRRLVGVRSTRSARPLVAILVALVGSTAALAVTLHSTSKASLIPVSEELRTTLAGLCQHVREDPCRPEVLASGGLPAEDAMTIVLADLGEKAPAFQAFLAAVGSVPPAQRHDALVATLSAATGAEWSCPEFEKLWNAQPVDWCHR